MRGIGLHLLNMFAAHVVKAVNQIGIAREGFGCGDILDPMLFKLPLFRSAIIGGSLFLYAMRAPRLAGGGSFSFVSRETALLGNNVLLAVASFVVFVGTMWPLVSELAFGRVLSVGAPFFNAAFTPFMVALAIARTALSVSNSGSPGPAP